MADEFICEGCGYPSAVEEKACPFCGERIVNINSIDQELAYNEAYNADEENAPDDEFDFDADEMPAV